MGVNNKEMVTNNCDQEKKFYLYFLFELDGWNRPFFLVLTIEIGSEDPRLKNQL
jgi:hypothetical protein